MKKLCFLIVLVFLVKVSFSQKKIEVNDGTSNIGGGNNPVLEVLIYEGDDKIIEKEWKSLMKSFKAKVSMKKEIFADDATIPSISDNTIDIYATIEKSGDYYKLTVGFNLGGAYLSKSLHSSQYKVASKLIYDFAVDVSKKAVEEQMKQAEKELKDMEKTHERLVRDNENLHKDIENYKAKITQAESDIETNIKDQATAQKNIENQKEAVKRIVEKKDAIK